MKTSSMLFTLVLSIVGILITPTIAMGKRPRPIKLHHGLINTVKFNAYVQCKKSAPMEYNAGDCWSDWLENWNCPHACQEYGENYNCIHGSEIAHATHLGCFILWHRRCDCCCTPGPARFTLEDLPNQEEYYEDTENWPQKRGLLGTNFTADAVQ